MAFAAVDEQVEVLLRGCEHVYSAHELAEKLEGSRRTGRPLRVKLGMDPTAPDIHLGHTVVLRKMRQFQDLGHVGVLIIGDFTARIGDPSGRSKTRPVLTAEEVEENARTYLSQAGRVLDTSAARLEVRRNSEWLAGMDFAGVLRLAGMMTVGQMLKREDFRRRFEQEQAIGVHELLYPLMQGWDSVNIEADVELGGTDQTFNNLVGRDLQQASGQAPQVVMIMPLLVGLDGSAKMSKTYGNAVAVTDPAKEMYGKIMSIPDALMRDYYTLLTEEPAERVEALCDAARTHPREAKTNLARLIVTRFYDAETAAREQEMFDRVFREGGLRDDVETVRVKAEVDGVWLPKLMKEAGLCGSTSEGKRLIAQGAVWVDETRVNDAMAKVRPASGMVIRAGKRRAVRIELD
jgi:tyrosyl-tRNA synthetase